jgi:hypothetical protein
MYTYGLSDISVGAVELTPTGAIPATGFTKIGETYQDSCKSSQEAAEVTAFYEEGKAVPAVSTEKKKPIVFSFSIMNPDPKLLSDYLGGSFAAASASVGSTWGWDGSETVANAAFIIKPKAGMTIYIPNGKVQAVLNAALSSKSLVLVDFTVTPEGVTSGKAIYAVGDDKTA